MVPMNTQAIFLLSQAEDTEPENGFWQHLLREYYVDKKNVL